jgi:predicted acetyltransferase
MIRFADYTTRQQVREMWKTVFGDPDEYINVYFRHKYRDENTLLYIEEGKAAASLQMLPYRFAFCGAEIPVIYLSGVCTLPRYRKRGYVRQLLIRSFEEAALRGVPLMLLVPQEKWLLDFYERYGFAQTFDAGESELPSLKELVAKHPGDLPAAFREFSAHFGQKEMTVQQSFADFRAIVEEAALYGFPPVKSLTGMARIIDAGKLLSLHGQDAFSIRVRDALIGNNDALFPSRGANAGLTLDVDVKELAQLLLGYHTSQKPAPLSALFPEKRPQLHFMLE